MAMLTVRWLKKRAFTLIELLVVIAIIGVLVGLLLPAVQKVREASNRLKCQNNLKQLAIAVHHFESTHGTMPPYQGVYPRFKGSVNVNNTEVYGGWFVHLLPYVEQNNLYGTVAQ